jgi:hypothetical protein
MLAVFALVVLWAFVLFAIVAVVAEQYADQRRDRVLARSLSWRRPVPLVQPVPPSPRAAEALRNARLAREKAQKWGYADANESEDQQRAA